MFFQSVEVILKSVGIIFNTLRLLLKFCDQFLDFMIILKDLESLTLTIIDIKVLELFSRL